MEIRLLIEDGVIDTDQATNLAVQLSELLGNLLDSPVIGWAVDNESDLGEPDMDPDFEEVPDDLSDYVEIEDESDDEFEYEPESDDHV